MFTCSTDDLPNSAAAGCGCCRPELKFASDRMTAELSRRGFIAGATGSFAALGLTGKARAQAPSPPMVFRNCMLFDGKASRTRGGVQVLVEGNRISRIIEGDAAPPDGARVIDCGGGVLMPGLIDAHWHTMFAALPLMALTTADIGFIFLAASAEAERTLMRGFTTVRDLGGPSFALAQAIDRGMATGPRIYPSGTMITTTGGHGDMRPLEDIPRSPGGRLSHMEHIGGGSIADTADEVRLRAREQLMQGATQIKMVGGGGVSSPRTTLDMFTYGEAEFRAGVETAADRRTYLTVHAYPPEQMQRALAAGTQCIEHGHLMDEATARMMAERGAWLSTQPFFSEEDQAPLTGQSRVNLLQVLEGTRTMYPLARRHGIKTAFGTDLLFSPDILHRQGLMLARMTNWYSPAESLQMATSGNGELMALSGPRNPYPGKLGVIEPGAMADMLVVNGDPTADLDLIADPNNFTVIVKDGTIYKDTRSGTAA
ncbi:imidazolonepropionase-like amidohydrolase [Brevundimonas lenta]|uniref:Imidazolonepropionase-like amidohydrolase n=2 Tax=Brevundimonas lenta TaxID=424796 RepID=A0A7W6NQ51_9CAUL|nr:imidazolonepropionase-like amidohydrolase [Brevundimonas lenta]